MGNPRDAGETVNCLELNSNLYSTNNTKVSNVKSYQWSLLPLTNLTNLSSLQNQEIQISAALYVWHKKIIDKDTIFFPKWSRTFIEFRESDKSLKHELGSI